MKSIIRISTVVLTLALICPLSIIAKQKSQALGIGGRYQVAHTHIEDLPFDDGDITYTASYEYHDRAGYWQLMLGYTPDVGKGDAVDYVITPQLNLILQDKIFLAGIGVLDSYVQTADDGGDWTDVYWQMILGLEFPVGPVSLGVMAYYQFDKWGDMISDFESDEIAYGGTLKYYF